MTLPVLFWAQVLIIVSACLCFLPRSKVSQPTTPMLVSDKLGESASLTQFRQRWKLTIFRCPMRVSWRPQRSYATMAHLLAGQEASSVPDATRLSVPMQTYNAVVLV